MASSSSAAGGSSSLPSPSCPDARKRRVSYFYELTIGDYYYGQGHPMKPHRIRMAHNLIIHYGLHHRLQINRPFHATAADIRRFHSDDYVELLSSVFPETLAAKNRYVRRFNVGEDCPVFDDLFPFCQASAGGSICAAVCLNSQEPTSPSTGPAGSTMPRSARPPVSATSTTSSWGSWSCSSILSSYAALMLLSFYSHAVETSSCLL